MTEANTIAGGRPPSTIISANSYNPIVQGSAGHPAEFPIGTPVSQSPSEDGAVTAARANAGGTAQITGIAAGRGVVGSRVIAQMIGPLTLSTDQWDQITGESGGLTRGATYFLDAAAEGRMTTTAPSGVGEIVRSLGIALSKKDFLIQVGQGSQIPPAPPTPPLLLDVIHYVVTGAELDPSSLLITLTTPQLSTGYGVIAQCQGDAGIVAFDVPDATKTTTQFVAVATGDLSPGDAVIFFASPILSFLIGPP